MMDERLVKENKELRRKMTAVMANARHNEERLQRFHEQELNLLSANGLVDLLRTALMGHRQVFGLESVTLAMVDTAYELRRLLADLGCDDAFPEIIVFESGSELTALFDGASPPRLGAFRASTHGILFAPVATPASVALIPLRRHGQLIGSLNLGSREEGRFIAGSATNFLERLGAVVAVALENAINHEQLKRIGLVDALTGVHNRRYFDHRLLEEVGRVLREREPLSCLFLDIDHFKRINDSHGHQVGDRVLQEVAGRIKAQLRLSDALGRYGGEEFSVLLVRTDTEQAREIAERIRMSIADRPFLLGGAHHLEVTLSVGLATLWPDSAAGLGQHAGERLLGLADSALYRAKAGGRNRVELATAPSPIADMS